MADPSTISGLIHWIRADDLSGLADGASVASWPDRVSGANAFAQTTTANQPTVTKSAFGGQDAVRFTGGQKALATVAETAPATFTLFAVFRYNTFAANAGPVGRDLTYNPRTFQFRTPSTTQAQLITFDAGGNPYFDTTPITGVMSPAVMTATLRAALNTEMFWNGGSDGPTANTAAQNTASTPIWLGTATAQGAGPAFVGDIAEAIFYNRALTTAERATVHSYVQDRYGITVADYTAGNSASPAYTGSGTVTTAAIPATTAVAGYSGAGTLAASATPAGAAVLGYSGTGTAAPSSTPSISSTVAYTGSGTVAAVGSAPGGASVGYTGGGTVAASTSLATSVTAAYGGTGQLGAAAGSSGGATAAYGGTGTLAATSAPAARAAVTYSGSGTFAATNGSASASPAAYAGAGQLTATIPGAVGAIRYGTTTTKAAYYGATRLTAIQYAGTRFAWPAV